MSALVSRLYSQADKLAWLPKNTQRKDEIDAIHSRRSSIEEYNTNSGDVYRLTPPGSPRYSMAPPPYENVIHTSSNQLENKRFGTLQNIWKRASFSASAAFGNDVKVMQPIIHTINKKEVDHAMTLMNVATDMNNSGNQQMAIDLYMMGLDKMISALPLDSDANVRSALEKKLVEVKERHQLSLISLSDLIQENEEAEEDKPLRSQISDLVINAAVLSAVALKKSPIPDALTSVANFAMSTAASVDEKHHIRERTWSIATAGVAKAVEVDRQFEIHQMLTGAMYTGLTAFVKAGIAYQETQAEANFISKRNSMRASASPAF